MRLVGEVGDRESFFYPVYIVCFFSLCLSLAVILLKIFSDRRMIDDVQLDVVSIFH